MPEKNKEHPLIELYGPDAIDSAFEIIQELKSHSNISFDKECLELGISFTVLKAGDIVAGKKKIKNLKALVHEAFGEAGIAKYNIGS
ncbi:hypothetical protein HXA34_20375 [Salipaludibacillus agaradhaerens]|jgi:hypothetical protein|uniref:hypothetical protein n=1 Tax=Salipaludibacillus agaradhaerens TaxID=76935 RepID=UPI002150917C|nr:hypothetical protein [Salipaludibacillus agaradhaerens]MCR6108654.1 hypothetical protein [Salipaludibacillus agaradhaerens]MCR6120678.1 hypothetical protein [Salipaludibacillus agaradhaerens]